MGELIIKHHDFEKAKGQIKKFSKNTTTDLDLKRVNDSKEVSEFLGDWIFGRGLGYKHKVTGEELNELTTQIQSHLHSINNTQIKLIKEFGQVYNALEALDKDYIQAILISIKSTEEASKSIHENQERIKLIVENQRKTLEELKRFKQKLDGYSHLDDIDKIWSDYQNWNKEINIILSFMEKLLEIKHLMEVDGIWKQTEDHKLRIKKLEVIEEKHISKLDGLAQNYNHILERTISNDGKINDLNDYKVTLERITYLDEVDSMFENLERHASQLSQLDKKNEKLIFNIQENREDVYNKIETLTQETKNTVESLTKKIKYAYWIAGGAVGLAIIELFIILLWR